jgi:hypothetical protein
MGFKAAPPQNSQFLSERQNFCGQLQKQGFATEFPRKRTLADEANKRAIVDMVHLERQLVIAMPGNWII